MQILVFRPCYLADSLNVVEVSGEYEEEVAESVDVCCELGVDVF